MIVCLAPSNHSTLHNILTFYFYIFNFVYNFYLISVQIVIIMSFTQNSKKNFVAMSNHLLIIWNRFVISIFVTWAKFKLFLEKFISIWNMNGISMQLKIRVTFIVELDESFSMQFGNVWPIGAHLLFTTDRLGTYSLGKIKQTTVFIHSAKRRNQNILVVSRILQNDGFLSGRKLQNIHAKIYLLIRIFILANLVHVEYFKNHWSNIPNLNKILLL